MIKNTQLRSIGQLLLVSLFLLCIFIMTGNAQQIVASDTVIVDGFISRSQLESYSWFATNYNTYAPKKSVIRKLKKKKKISVLVILGTWCSDSKEHVPALLKVCDEAGIKNIAMIGVNREKVSTPVKIYSYQVSYVPLIIIYRNKTEIGRIVETPKKSIEEDLLKIIR